MNQRDDATEWRSKVEAIQWDAGHTDHYLLARAMAYALDFPKEALRSETRRAEEVPHSDAHDLHLLSMAWFQYVREELSADGLFSATKEAAENYRDRYNGSPSALSATRPSMGEARYQWLLKQFKEHGDGWTIHETVWGAPSLEGLEGCIDAMMGRK